MRRQERKLIDEYAEIEDALRGDMQQNGYEFGSFFQWFMGVIGVAIAALLCWMCVSVTEAKTDIAVLKDRPPPVSQETFAYRMDGVERRLTALEVRAK